MAVNVTRRGFLALASAGVVGALSVACGGAPSTPTTAPAASAPTSAPATSAPAAAASTPAPAPTTAQPAAQSTPQSAASGTLRFSSYSFGDFETFAKKNIFTPWNPNVTVQTEFAGGDEYYTKLQTQIASGSPPDLGISDYAHTVSYAKSGSLLVLDDLLSRDKYSLDTFPKAGRDQYRWHAGDFNTGGEGGQMYALPSDAQGFIFVYNKSMFDQAGVKYPTNDWTWDDVVTAGKQITKADQNKWGVYIPAYGTLFRGNFVYAAGGDVLSSDAKKSGLDMPGTIDALKWAWDLVYTHKIAPKPVPTEAVNPFASGRVAMWFDGIWTVLDWSAIKDFQWDMAMLPKHPKTGKRTTSLESDGWWIFKAAKQPDLAWSLMKYLLDPSTQAKLADGLYVVPPSNADSAKAWYAQKPPDHRSIALDNLNSDARKVSLTFYQAAQMRTDSKVAIDKAWYDGQDIVTQAKAAATIMNQDLDKGWKDFS